MTDPNTFPSWGLTPEGTPAQGLGQEPPMSRPQIQQWIEACNHEPSRDVLRHYLTMTATLAPAPAPQGGDLRAALESAAAWHEARAKSLASLSDPNSNHRWAMREHQEQACALRAALASSPEPDVLPGLSQAERDVLAERRRQVEAEGWTLEHDDEHSAGEMASAAACYATQGRYHFPERAKPGPLWPWEPAWWNPGPYRQNLVKAGALIVAEIERLDRAEIDRREGGER